MCPKQTLKFWFLISKSFVHKICLLNRFLISLLGIKILFNGTLLFTNGYSYTNNTTPIKTLEINFFPHEIRLERIFMRTIWISGQCIGSKSVETSPPFSVVHFFPDKFFYKHVFNISIVCVGC